MFGTIARQIAALDEAGEAAYAVAQGDFDAIFLNHANGTGDNVALLEADRHAFERILRELLDAEADAFFFAIDVQNLDFDSLALLIALDRFFASNIPR